MVKGVIAVDCFKLWEVAEQYHAGTWDVRPTGFMPIMYLTSHFI